MRREQWSGLYSFQTFPEKIDSRASIYRKFSASDLDLEIKTGIISKLFNL